MRGLGGIRDAEKKSAPTAWVSFEAAISPPSETLPDGVTEKNERAWEFGDFLIVPEPALASKHKVTIAQVPCGQI